MCVFALPIQREDFHCNFRHISHKKRIQLLAWVKPETKIHRNKSYKTSTQNQIVCFWRTHILLCIVAVMLFFRLFSSLLLLFFVHLPAIWTYEEKCLRIYVHKNNIFRRNKKTWCELAGKRSHSRCRGIVFAFFV